jgi:hypothetical protein
LLIFAIALGELWESPDPTDLTAPGTPLLGAAYIGAAYSGDPRHVNDPRAVGDKGEGPLPPGVYELGAPFDAADTGPYSIPLSQIEGESYGRGGFRIHGDSLSHPGAASHGCIVTAPEIRRACVAAGPLLTVVP